MKAYRVARQNYKAETGDAQGDTLTRIVQAVKYAQLHLPNWTESFEVDSLGGEGGVTVHKIAEN